MAKNANESPAASLLAVQQKIEDAVNEFARVNPSATIAASPTFRDLYQTRRQILTDIPSFWLTAMLSHPAFTFLINASDTQVLRHLVDLDVLPRSKSINAADFDLVFTFTPNPYFSETQLVKQYIHSEHNGRVVTVAPVSWTFQNKLDLNENPMVDPCQLTSGFFSWISTDTVDNASLGELIRDQIFPYAINLYFGTFNLDMDNTDQNELLHTTR